MDILTPIQSLLGPWTLLARSVYYLPPTIFRLGRAREWSALWSWSRFQSAWFAAFWQWAGPLVRDGARTTVVPLLQGRIRSGEIFASEKPSTPPISGTVLEIGAGSGMWVPVLGELYAQGQASQTSPSSSSTSSPSIAKIYGVEPNTGVHAALQAQVVAAGLTGVYEVLPMGIEDLAASGTVAEGSIDCVVCVLCLCGIPEPEANIRALYGYLKPGGRLYAYEHVRCSRHWSVQLYQRLLNLLWPAMIGGCELLRDTGRSLRAAGPWTSVDLAQPVTEPWYQPIPHIVGVLTK